MTETRTSLRVPNSAHGNWVESKILACTIQRYGIALFFDSGVTGVGVRVVPVDVTFLFANAMVLIPCTRKQMWTFC